jgi:hypothetical protein
MRSKVSSTSPVMTTKKSTEKFTTSKSVVAVPAAIALQLGQLVGAIVGSIVVGLAVGSGGNTVGLGELGAGDRVGSSEQYLGGFVGLGVNVGRGDTVGVTGDLVFAFPLLVGLKVIDGAGDTVGDLVFFTFVGAGDDPGVGSWTHFPDFPDLLDALLDVLLFPSLLPRKMLLGIFGTCSLR